MSISELIFGRRLASNEIGKQQIGPLIGVAVFGLDAISSSAYGPEAALTVLLPFGSESIRYIGPITVATIILLLILFFSYRQTITAYPNGGGSYTVAKENLGSFPGLIAAAGLSMDYILNVGVAISAGVGALVSAVPVLLPHTTIICLIILAILSIVNLRGVREAGVLFIAPTYFFIVCISVALIIGIIRSIISHGHPIPVVSPPLQVPSPSTVGIWLILRSFASGCSAMTGVEAVSNGIPVFKQPSEKHAKIALSLIIITLMVLLAGITYIVKQYHIGATSPGQAGYQSILSQIFEAIFGRGAVYYASIASVIMILILSANTSYAGFPWVCRLLAIDNFLPKVFSHRGRRLVYAEGIYVMIIIDAVLLIVFRGITDRLIPLFAIGAFIAFTCSQAGMVMHWWNRRADNNALYSLVINLVGASSTFIAFAIIFCSKFLEGAWLTLLIIPVLVMMFQRERNYVEKISRKVHLTSPINVKQLKSPIAVLPISVLDRIAEKGIRLGLKISSEFYVVHVTTDDDDSGDLKKKWKELVEDPSYAEQYHIPQLVIVSSKYRELIEPIINFISTLTDKYPDRQIAVIIPQIIEPRWYHYIFRNTAMLIESNLLWKDWPNVFVISSPMHLTEQ